MSARRLTTSFQKAFTISVSIKMRADRVRKVEEIIEEVGLLPEHLTRYPHEFQEAAQRIGLARAMVMNPEFGGRR